MSKSTLSKASVILVGLSMLAITISPTFALDSTGSATRPAIRNQLVQQKVETNKENIASKASALKTKLQAFKDKRKAEIADRVNTNLNRINQNQTAQMQKHLGTMSGILDRLEARVNQGTPDIKDPAGAKAAIASARAAISTTSAAVTTQSEKDYTITVTSESRIGLDAKTQRDKLHADISAVRIMVVDAKQSVANAIRIAKSGSTPIGKTVIEKEGTTSGQR